MMPTTEKIKEVIDKLRVAKTSGDKSKECDAISLAYRMYGDIIPAISSCYEEAVMFSGTIDRNISIIIDLLDEYLKVNNDKSKSDSKTSITNLEKGMFLKLFNRNGYVLNFSTNDFNVFTMQSVGIALSDYYNTSKGKSLTAFVNEADENKIEKLLLDLFDYYEHHYEEEYNKELESYGYDTKFSKTYYDCKKIVERIRGTGIPLSQVALELKDSFSTQYMTNQFELLLSLCDSNPTEAIGKAKELIESCCITILDERNVKWDKKWDVGQLAGKTVKQLRLTPEDIPEDVTLAKDMKAILGNLRAIATNMANLRNPYGSGHGKTASYRGLEKRHARLAVGSCITFVEFLWSTHESRKNGNK